jgi:hypothetical protein
MDVGRWQAQQVEICQRGLTVVRDNEELRCVYLGGLPDRMAEGCGMNG